MKYLIWDFREEWKPNAVPIDNIQFSSHGIIHSLQRMRYYQNRRLVCETMILAGITKLTTLFTSILFFFRAIIDETRRNDDCCVEICHFSTRHREQTILTTINKLCDINIRITWIQLCNLETLVFLEPPWNL